jgi:hypothetical protein
MVQKERRLDWKVLMGMGVAAGLVAFSVAQAQQTTRGATLTPQDYFEIQQLVARYPYAFDTSEGKGTVYADLFTPDGAFINQDGRHEGRAALERMGGLRRNEAPLNVAHYITNHVIEPLPGGGARGKQYLMVLTIGEDGPLHGPRPGSIRLGGQYRDEYQKTPEGWRFKTRQFMNKDTTEAAIANADKLRTQTAVVRQAPAPQK